MTAVLRDHCVVFTRCISALSAVYSFSRGMRFVRGSVEAMLDLMNLLELWLRDDSRKSWCLMPAERWPADFALCLFYLFLNLRDRDPQRYPAEVSWNQRLLKCSCPLSSTFSTLGCSKCGHCIKTLQTVWSVKPPPQSELPQTRAQTTLGWSASLAYTCHKTWKTPSFCFEVFKA